MKVRYIRGKKGTSMSNIMFPQIWQMRGGKLPKEHPCHANKWPMIWGAGDYEIEADPLSQFRARGYVASCFPEGDGICFPEDAAISDERVIADIQECFGFEVSK